MYLHPCRVGISIYLFAPDRIRFKIVIISLVVCRHQTRTQLNNTTLYTPPHPSTLIMNVLKSYTKLTTQKILFYVCVYVFERINCICASELALSLSSRNISAMCAYPQKFDYMESYARVTLLPPHKSHTKPYQACISARTLTFKVMF